MPLTVLAKFRLVAITEHEGGNKTLKFETRYAEDVPEDRRFMTATPWGSIEMHVDNPSALGFFEMGKHYYADFSRAPDS